MVDYLIIGQGLAGVSLAWHLHDYGKKVALFDVRDHSSSSRIAAGLYNPITGRKMVKTWKADSLFPYLRRFYHDKMNRLAGSFLTEMTIYRPFKTVEEQNEWMSKSSDPHYAPYIEKLTMSGLGGEYADPMGGVWLKNCGFLKVSEYIDQSIAYFHQQNIPVYKTSLVVDKLSIEPDQVAYMNTVAKSVVFCDGVTDLSTSLFKWLPFTPVKGELLEIETDLNLPFILNRGVFIIPLGNNRFKVGATYDNHDRTKEPTVSGKTTVESKLRELINVKYEVKDHYAGIRPATRDRKPFLGMHPKYKNVSIFNGLGAKGVSLAPFFANQFATHLVNQSALDKEVNIARYYSLYKD